jgi:hypothetical protein
MQNQCLLLNVRIAGLGLSVGTVTTGTEFYKCHTSTLQLLHIPQSFENAISSFA